MHTHTLIKLKLNKKYAHSSDNIELSETRNTVNLVKLVIQST